MLRADIFKEILEPKEFTTWVDSLAIAAGALAREKAGYTISRIAEELGRTEATIRNHLQGKTKAGKLVKETYEMLVREGKVKLALPVPLPVAAEASEEAKKLEERVKKLESLLRSLASELKSLAEKIEGEVR
jgi:probable regulatory domain-containing protein